MQSLAICDFEVAAIFSPISAEKKRQNFAFGAFWHNVRVIIFISEIWQVGKGPLFINAAELQATQTHKFGIGNRESHLQRIKFGNNHF